MLSDNRDSCNRDCGSYLEYTNVKDDLILNKCLCCNKNCKKKKKDKNVKERFANTYKFTNYDINKFILLLRKGVYSYWIYGRLQKGQLKPLPEKEDFYSHLNMEDITGADYAHTKI